MNIAIFHLMSFQFSMSFFLLILFLHTMFCQDFSGGSAVKKGCTVQEGPSHFELVTGFL
jgi:hypothetical protein